jgi:hypothetical protein
MVRGYPHCVCCGQPWRTSDNIGPSCDCTQGNHGFGAATCSACGKCAKHCACPAGYTREWSEVERRRDAGTLPQQMTNAA